MSVNMDTAEDEILRSWRVNARPWTKAVRSDDIVSRTLVTNQAIVGALLGLRPRRVLDVGCGEGWLARSLCRHGVEVIGVDAEPALIAEATRLGGGSFEVHTHGELAAGRLNRGSFDAAVCNFSLFGNESVDSVLGAAGAYLNTPGYLVVQTLHPVASCGNEPYEDGWRKGSWTGFSAEFSEPAPWFFRTLASWYAMLRRSGFEVLECREPTALAAPAPSSILFVCIKRSAAAGL